MELNITESINDEIQSGLMSQDRAWQIAEIFSREGANQLKSHLFDIKELMSYYRCAILEVETKFRVLNEQLSLLYERNPIDSIHSRLKSPESIYQKIKKKNFPLTLKSIEENIDDIAGVRVVCCFVNDVYKLAECFINQDDIRVLEIEDYIKNPKKNGYRSLHLIVEVPIFLTHGKKMMKVEVQLRTVAMDFWASLEHKIYYKKEINESAAEKAAAELTECAMMCADLDRRMQKIRDDIDLNGEKE